MKLFYVLPLLILSSCISLPENITPVQGFELNKYLGKWYEVARLDHSFERGLSHVSASYSLKDDGGVKVINRGYDEEEKTWDEAEGKAYFVREADEGYLKVSFFGPFYGAYIIFELDEDYQYSFVSGPNKDYLWLLSRTPTISDGLKARFLQKVKGLGYDTHALIFPNQSPPQLLDKQ